ncbi:hypothetical protein MTO96_014922 [Rhipicephalus appendiculatus]
MNAEAATPNTSSEVETSGGSSLQVRHIRGLGALISQLNPIERRLSQYNVSGPEDLCSDTDEHGVPAASHSPPDPAASDSKVSRKKSSINQRPTSRILKSEAESSSKESKGKRASDVTTATQGTSALLLRSVVPPKVRRSTTAESSSLPFRRCGDETIGEHTSGCPSVEEVIDSVPKSQRATAKRRFVISGIKEAFSGYSSGTSDGALLFDLFVLPCVAAVLLGSVLLFLVLMHSARAKSVTSMPRITSIEDDSRIVCYTSVCQEVIALLAETADRTVEPCGDFYRHVCGNWEEVNGVDVNPLGADEDVEPHRSPSYEEANIRAFVARINRNLEYITQDPSRCAPRDCRMAVFYESCMQFATSQGWNKSSLSVLEVLERAEVDRRAWQEAPTLLDLLRLVVDSSVRTGLVPAPSARLSESGDIFIDVGESLSHVLEPHGREEVLVGSFVGNSLAELSEDLSNVSQGAVLAVDANVEGIRKTLDPSVHRKRGPRMNARTMRTSCAVGIPCGLELSIKSNAVIELFGTVDLGLVAVYLLLLTVSHVVKYEYLLHPLEVHDRMQSMQICLQATAEYFPGRFPFWLASTVETPEARFYLDEMVANLKQSATDMAYDGKLFVINGSEFTTTPVTTIHPKRSVQNGEAPALSEAFPLSILQLSMEPLDQDWLTALEAAQQQLRGDITAQRSTTSGEGAVVVPSLFLSADMMHSEDLEETLDYSTVGVRLLIAWANMATATDNGEMSNASSKDIAAYRQCVADRIAEDTGTSLSQDALRFVLFLPWALDVALLSSTRGTYASKRVGVLRAKQRLFFRRFCQTTCGDPEAADACRYGVINSQAFSEAFYCARQPLPLKC